MLEANSSSSTTTGLAQPRPRPRLSLLKLRSSHGSKKAFRIYENLSSFKRKKISPEAEMTSSYRTTGIPVLKRPSQTSFLHSTFKSAASCRPNKTTLNNGGKVQLTSINKCNHRPVKARQNGSVDSDSSSSRCSTDSLIANQLEKQEIPSQMVATLAGQFNALIERRKVQQRQLKSPSENQNIIIQSPPIKSPSTNRIIIQKKKTEVTTTIRSCPSSPQPPTSGAFTRGKWSSVGHSGVSHSGSVSVNRSRSSLGSIKSDFPKRNISVSTDSCDSVAERTFRSLKDDSKLTAVQRAARNYESALNLHKAIISSSSSALSSPTTTSTTTSSSSRISVNYSDINTKPRPKVKPPEVPASMLRPKLELNHLKNDLSTSMDLLAEIDCHLKINDNNNTITSLKEPNRSFLWKSSTQKRFSEQTEGEEIELEDDDSEHLYEELTTFLSIQNRDRLDVPLAVPENDSSSSSSSYGYAAASLSYSVARCSLKSNSSNSEQGQKETVTEADAESDGGSWADDSDDEGQHWRKNAFRRKAWNRNARDSDSKMSSNGEVQSGGEGLWEDGGADENIYEPLTEPEDASSRVSGGGKKVKRNWSWSKTRTEFHLDISSKLGRIRPTAKKSSNSQSSQPNSNHKWPFKGSTGEVYKANRKTSPTEASAQFYVPSSSSSSSSTINDVGGKTNNRRSSSYLSRPTTAPPLPPVQINSGTTAKEDTDDDSSSTGISRSSESISRIHENDEQSKRFLYLDDTYYIDEDHKKLSPFDNEPLYQFYTMAAQQRSAHENQVDSSEDEDDCYESVNQVTAIIGDDVPESTVIVSDDLKENKILSVPSAMELVRLTEGGVRTLWCEVPEVVASGLLQTITIQQRNLQEAMFEVITSEASYLKSLNILINHFMMCPMFLHEFSSECVLSKRERHVLFSDVIPVKETSERLLEALEKRWQENILLSDICDILLHHATKYFEVYVKYCSNQLYQDRCLKKLKESNNDFIEVIRRLESNPTCQGLNMYSFLMLPMQRITRLPLLVDAILNRLDSLSPNYDTCKQALATLNKIVHECNEGAQRMARMEEMLNISRQLDFRMFKGLALISASRWLIKQGELVRLLLGDSCKLSFGRSRFPKQVVHLFLFTDILIVTKKKSDDCYHVVDYSPRNMLQVTEGPDQLPDRLLSDGCRNLFQLTMLQNHNGKTVEMFFTCPMESDRTRWVEAIAPKRSEDPDEKIYEEWDCPQVQAIHNYTAQQPDELSLEESDVVNVFRKMADGWYQGERIRDGSKGWFPANYTVEIVSSHVRARNLRQRYRLLALSQSYLEQQQKKDYKLIKC